jgi:YbbR domain-containing protein
MINKNTESRDKWFARFMCVLIACCLWLYVMSEQNPIVEKEYAIPLVSRNLTEGMIVFNVPEKVSVRVRGTRTALANMPLSDIFAYVNLSKLSVGTHTVLINARFARGDVIQVTPPAVNLFIDVKKDKIVPVTAEIIGSPNKDFAVDSHLLTPSEVKVEGAATRLEALDKIFVPVDVGGRSEEFSVTLKPLAVAKDGIDMQDVTIDPAEIIVRTKMKKKIQTVTIPVKVSYKGELAGGLKITSATVNPFKVTVSGPPSVVDNLKELNVEPVDLGQITKNATVPVKIILPDGVTAARQTVDVDLTVDNAAEEKTKE